MEDPKWLVYLNVALAVVVKVGGLGFALKLAFKGLDWLDGWIKQNLERAGAAINEFKIMQQTQVDEQLIEELQKLSFTTFKTLKGTLKEMLADGEITRDEYRVKLHEDVKANFKKAVPVAKKRLFEQAYEDLDDVIDVLLPGVVDKAKQEARDFLRVDKDTSKAVKGAINEEDTSGKS